MKRMFCVILFLAVTLTVLFAQNIELPRLAVVEFSTNIKTDKVNADAITVRNLVESQMVGTRKYQIITRDEIDKLLANQRIQVSSISSSENIKKLQLQNISYIVTGSVDAMGDNYAITVKVLDVSTGQFAHSNDDFMGGSPQDLYNGIKSLMTKFVTGMTSEGGRVTQTESGKIYKVGDIGPARGYIFYDKGILSNGWRYLEAAPAETEFIAQWGAYGTDISGTNTGIGGGKLNIEIIVERLKQLGESGKAAQVCVNLYFNGYKDWFLPSKDELDLMYKNLKQKGLGGFNNNWYWSSSHYGNKGSAWNQNFSDGSQEGYSRDSTLSVRAVRAF